MYSNQYSAEAIAKNRVIRQLFIIFVILSLQNTSSFAQTTPPNKIYFNKSSPTRTTVTSSSAATPLTNQAGLLGTWSQSPSLSQIGITPFVSLTSDIQSNPSGGRSQGLTQFSNVLASLSIDLQKLMGAPGTKFYTSFSERFGNSLTKEYIGNAFNVAQVCCGATYRFVDLYLEQPVIKDHLNIRAGRFATGEEFLASPLYFFYVQNGIDGNPQSIFRNAPGMTTYPTATWGTRARITFIEEIDLMLGAFNGDRTLSENNKHGMDWSLNGPGFYIGELGFHPNKNSESELPGNYKIGLYYDNGIFSNFLHDSTGGTAATSGLPNETRQGNTGYYILMDQMIYRKTSGKSPKGIIPFISYIAAPNAAYNIMPFFINGGLVYQSPFDSRENDAAGVAFIYGSFSNTQREAQRINNPTLQTQNFETVFELFYLVQATNWLKVQPDLQYIINPDGTGDIPNATVIGAQVVITL
jgi:porin